MYRFFLYCTPSIAEGVIPKLEHIRHHKSGWHIKEPDRAIVTRFGGIGELVHAPKPVDKIPTTISLL
jgi:hypothetical protein